MPYTGSPPTFSTGEKSGVAAKLNQLRDFARSLTDSSTPWTPSLTATGTNPTNWTATGAYFRAGKLVVARFSVTAGASSTAGSGNYRLALPATAVGALSSVGVARAYDQSTGNIVLLEVNLASADNMGFDYPAAAPIGGFTQVANTSPWAWSTGDYIAGQLIYEAA